MAVSRRRFSHPQRPVLAKKRLTPLAKQVGQPNAAHLAASS
jgi:hypothetical protein